MIDAIEQVKAMNRADLLQFAMEQIRKDVELGGLEALYVMLEHLPNDVLAAYLPEE